MNDDFIPPPPVVPPPVESAEHFTSEAYSVKSNRRKKVGSVATMLAVIATKAKTIGYALLAILKFGKLGKALLTGGSMAVSVWAYAQWFGIPFAIGFVLLIFVHEMGHVYVAWRMGIPVSAPIFIPFMGALILTKKYGNKLLTQDALIGIGGPAFGTAGAIVCALIYLATGSLFFLGLAFVTFFLNLFNLIPIYPLDGGWIVRAISPILWLVGMAIILGMVVTGHVRNPMVFILIILGIPTMYTELRAMIKRIPSPVPPDFRWKMGGAYVGLALVCAAGMGLCLDEMHTARLRSRGRPGPAVARREGAPRTVFSPPNFSLHKEGLGGG